MKKQWTKVMQTNVSLNKRTLHGVEVKQLNVLAFKPGNMSLIQDLSSFSDKIEESSVLFVYDLSCWWEVKS